MATRLMADGVLCLRCDEFFGWGDQHTGSHLWAIKRAILTEAGYRTRFALIKGTPDEELEWLDDKQATLVVAHSW